MRYDCRTPSHVSKDFNLACGDCQLAQKDVMRLSGGLSKVIQSFWELRRVTDEDIPKLIQKIVPHRKSGDLLAVSRDRGQVV